MGYSGANSLILTAGKHAQHMLDNEVEKDTVKTMLYDILQEVADMDFDDFDSCAGHWGILDEVMTENEFVIGPPKGEHKIKWWLGADEWSLQEHLCDHGIINVRDDFGWMKYTGTEVACEVVVDFDNEKVYLTSVSGVELPKRAEI